MDALRKAEQQKRQAADSSPAPVRRDTPEPLGLEPLPELPKRLEELDDQFLASDPGLQKSIRALAAAREHASESGAPTAPSGGDAARRAAQNVFAAKQAAPMVRHGFAIAVGASTLVALAAIGGYVYWQMQPRGGIVAAPGLAKAIPPQAVAPPAAGAAAPAAAAATPRPAGPTPSPAGNAAPREAPPATAQPRNARPPEANRLAPTPDAAIRVSPRSPSPDATMETAHAAFARGETELARVIWQKALQSDPRNSNALHGLAALALKEGRPEQAEPLYRRALEVDPKDALAFAGLLSIAAPADARRAESRLRGLLAEQPDAPQLHFALGNLYLADSRWAEAQQSFFKAHTADPANPDYLYNLAVSLDHMNQTRLAAQYYARALAAGPQPAAFDRAQAEIRLRQLQAAHAQ